MHMVSALASAQQWVLLWGCTWVEQWEVLSALELQLVGMGKECALPESHASGYPSSGTT